MRNTQEKGTYHNYYYNHFVSTIDELQEEVKIHVVIKLVKYISVTDVWNIKRSSKWLCMFNRSYLNFCMKETSTFGHKSLIL